MAEPESESIELIVETRTLGDLLAAVEGLRGQLSTFSMEALAEIDQLKYWIQNEVNIGNTQVVITSKFTRDSPPEPA